MSVASPEFKNLMKGLLTYNSNKRIGASGAGATEIKNHPFFKCIDWDMMTRKELTPPFLPKVDKPACLLNVDKYYLA